MSNQNLPIAEGDKINHKEIEDYKDRINKMLSDLNDPNTFKSIEEKIKLEVTDTTLTDKKLNVFLSILGKKLSQLKDKTNGIKIIKTVAVSLKQIDVYLSKLLTIIQTIITEENRDFYMLLASTFGDIVSITKNIVLEKSMVYEILQGFCFYNIRRDTTAHQLCGSLCLEYFIKNCPLVQNPVNLKFIWENICVAIENTEFKAKTEILSALKTLIVSADIRIQPYAVPTLYKVFDILSDTDWYRKKLVLNIIHQLTLAAPNDIIPLKSYITDYLMIAKNDKVLYIII